MFQSDSLTMNIIAGLIMVFIAFVTVWVLISFILIIKYIITKK